MGKLTDKAVVAAKPFDKQYKVADGDGLALIVKPNGTKLWWFRYRFEGKEKTLALGVYPVISLKDARDRCFEARKLLVTGIDPSGLKQEAKKEKARASEEALAIVSFEEVAREWFARHSPNWAPGHSSKIIRRLEVDVFPWIGANPISSISAPIVLGVLRRIEDRGVLETAYRAKTNISQIMRYAVATGRADRDPCPDLKGALRTPETTNFAAITDPKEVGALLRAIDGLNGTLVVKSALQLAPLLFVRPGELRTAQWAEIDLDKAEWRYFVTKTSTDHSVPLSSQAVAILRDLRALTGAGLYVFPGGRDPKRPMSDAAVNAALRRMGYDTKTEITGHGFRAMARTILAEELHVDPQIIEHQLAHNVPDPLGTAYNRTKFLKDRRVMMQDWADYLDELKMGATIIPFKRA